MAHFFYLPYPHHLTGLKRRSSVPLPQPPQSEAEMSASEFILSSSKRNQSISSNEGSGPPSPTTGYVPEARRNSALAAHRTPRAFNSTTVRTRSIPGVWGSAGVVFERDEQPPSDDDIIIVTVRLSNKFRRSSVDGAEELPSRPPARSFFRRLSTRVTSTWDHSAEKEQRYKAVKMPRGEYKRHFKRDREGNYAGTEPERDWDEGELMKEYAAYQDIPLHSMLC